MSSPPDTERSTAFQTVIYEFLQKRLEVKLAEVATDLRLSDDADRQEKTAKLRQQFEPSMWLADAACRAPRIQLATHTIKGIHPKARGTSLLVKPESMAQLDEVGTHTLGGKFKHDAAANAADLDVFSLLKLPLGDSTFLRRCLDEDPNLSAALSDNPETAKTLIDAFATVALQRGELSTHTLAKQVYWCIGNDPCDDSQYHLLAPLFPSSLTDALYHFLQFDLYSEEVNAARAAKGKGLMHATPIRAYPALVKQTLGGSTRKAQNNVSDLNGARRGTNYLLASLPPVWQSTAVKPILHTNSLFKVFRHRPQVRANTNQLWRFLEGAPAPNSRTSAHRAELVEALLDEFVQFTMSVRMLEPGWTTDASCELPNTHKVWLDPDSVDVPPADLVDSLAIDFALWMNEQLRERLPMGHPEYQHWRRQARELFKEWEREGWHELA